MANVKKNQIYNVSGNRLIIGVVSPDGTSCIVFNVMAGKLESRSTSLINRLGKLVDYSWED